MNPTFSKPMTVFLILTLSALMLVSCASSDAPTAAPILPGDSTNNGQADSGPTTRPPIEEVIDQFEATEAALATPEPRLTSAIAALLDNPDDAIAPEAILQPTFDPLEPTPLGALPVPLPGTLVASETEDPEITPGFNRLVLFREGGPLLNGQQPEPVTIEIYNDGRILRNGIAGSISRETIDSLALALDEINFFGMQNVYMGVYDLTSGDFFYQLTVASPILERQLNLQDGYMPTEVAEIVARIITEGQRIQP